MGSANADLVRRGYEAFQKGDMEALSKVMSEDVIWHVPGKNPLSGDYKNQADTFAYYGQLAERTGGNFSVDVHDICASDDHVVGLHRNKGSRNGRSLDADVIIVFHVRGDKIVEAWENFSDQSAVDAFWA